MALPVALLLSEWCENKKQVEVSDVQDLKIQQTSTAPQRISTEPPSDARRNDASQARPNDAPQARPNIAKSEEAQKVLLQRQQDINLKALLLKVDSLMSPNLNPQTKYEPRAFQAESSYSVSNRKMYRRPTSKHIPYPVHSETGPRQTSASVDSFQNRLDYHSNHQRIGNPRFQSDKATQHSSFTLAEYFRFKKVSKLLPPLPEAPQSWSSSPASPGYQDNLPLPMVCDNPSKRIALHREKPSTIIQMDTEDINSPKVCDDEMETEDIEYPSPTQVPPPQTKKNDADSSMYLPVPLISFTQISLVIKDANTKLNRIIKGLALDMTAPFEYFDDGVFKEEIVMHRILYASGSMFRGKKSKEREPKHLDEESGIKRAATTLLTCNQLEKALSSKLSADATPFTYKRHRSGERIETRPKISVESFMEFLSGISDITIKSSSENLSYANFLDPLLTPYAGKPENQENTDQTRKSTQTHVSDLEGQRLTEEEENNGCSAGLRPIGTEMKRSTDTAPAPTTDVKIMYGGRNILEMGINVRDQWKDINRWQVGPNVKGKEDDKQDRDKEWKKSNVKRCEDCSFHYHED